jgi:hypothetical protein
MVYCYQPVVVPALHLEQPVAVPAPSTLQVVSLLATVIATPLTTSLPFVFVQAVMQSVWQIVPVVPAPAVASLKLHVVA